MNLAQSIMLTDAARPSESFDRPFKTKEEDVCYTTMLGPTQNGLSPQQIWLGYSDTSSPQSQPGTKWLFTFHVFERSGVENAFQLTKIRNVNGQRRGWQGHVTQEYKSWYTGILKLRYWIVIYNNKKCVNYIK